MRRTVICRPRMRFISMFSVQRFQIPAFPRSRIPAFPPSTFNVQRPTFNAQRFRIPTFNVQHSTTNVQRSHIPAFQRSTFARSTSQHSPFSCRLSAIVYRLSAIGYQLPAMISLQPPSIHIHRHTSAHPILIPAKHKIERQRRDHGDQGIGHKRGKGISLKINRCNDQGKKKRIDGVIQ